MIHFKIQLIISSLILSSIHDGVFAHPEIEIEKDPEIKIEIDPTKDNERKSQVCKEELNKRCGGFPNLSKCLKHFCNNIAKLDAVEDNSYAGKYTMYLFTSANFNNCMTLNEYIKDDETMQLFVEKVGITFSSKGLIYPQKLKDLLAALEFLNKIEIIENQDARLYVKNSMEKYVNYTLQKITFNEDVQEYNEWCNNPPELKINL